MIGQTLENYKIIAKLGEGGVAEVYLVENLIDNKLYALKMLKQDYVSNSNIRKRFIDEAKKLAQIDSINVAKVYKTIDQGDIVAFSMEYIDGATLQSKGKLEDDTIKDYMYQILEGLKTVHSKGIIHRDLTPCNIMITNNGLVKILDFGISKDLNNTIHDGTIMGTTVMMGTPRYMSPEQYNNTASTRETSDIYSLGVILWEMVKGEMIYSKINTMHSLGDKILKEPLTPTKTCWDKIIQKATRKNPKDRYKSCEEFIQAIKTNKYGVIFPWKKITIISAAVLLFIIGIVAISNMGGKEQEKIAEDSTKKTPITEKESKTEGGTKEAPNDNVPEEKVDDEGGNTNTTIKNKDEEENVEAPKKEKIIIIPTKLTRIPNQNKITWNPELTNNAEKITISFVANGKTWAEDEVFGSSYDYSPGNSDAGGVFTTVTLSVILKDGKKIIGNTVLSKQIFKCN
jgi:serine/threonine protein kinase